MALIDDILSEFEPAVDNMTADNIANEDPMDLDDPNHSQEFTIDASMAVDQSASGLKRSHRVAFGCDDGGYGGVRQMKMRDYCGRRKPTLATAQPPQQPRHPLALKSCLSRHKGDEGGKCQLKGARKAVRFNEAVQVLWCWPHTIVGDDEGLETTYVSKVPSPSWQAYLARKAASRRDMLQRNLQTGTLSSCVVFMMPQNVAMSAEAIHESSAGPVRPLLHPIFRYATGKPERPTGPTSAEVEVLHVTNEELHRQAVDIIDAIVTTASNHPKLARNSIYPSIFRNNVNNEGLYGRVDLLACGYKKGVEDVFRSRGMLHPYHTIGQLPAVADARKDGDWSEVHARAATLCKACPPLLTVRAVEELLVEFKDQVDKIIDA